MNKISNRNVNNNTNNGNFYQRIDNSIMKGVNKAVRAWNWTTGRTKADLANTIVVAGMASTLTAAFLDKSYLTASAVDIGFGTLLVMINKHIEKLEKEAVERNALDINAEKYKSFYKVFGPFNVGITIPSLISQNPHIGFTRKLSYLGGTFFGIQAYIMRADYLPPRKSAFAIGWEKAKEWLRTPVPEPVHARINYISILRI